MMAVTIQEPATMPSDEPGTVPAFYHATPARNLESILSRGLIASTESHPHLELGGVYLTHQVAVAINYADMGFGSDDPDEPWVVLRVDGDALDPSLLRADDGHETRSNLDDIVARGFTPEQVEAGDFPWRVCLEETGQVVYVASIPPAALSVEREFTPGDDAPRPF